MLVKALNVETAVQESREFGRRAVGQPGPWNVLSEHRGERVRDGLALKQPLAREHFEEHDAKRPDVRALVGVALAPAGARALARPKSSTFTAPSSLTLMLAGFRSR